MGTNLALTDVDKCHIRHKTQNRLWLCASLPWLVSNITVCRGVAAWTDIILVFSGLQCTASLVMMCVFWHYNFQPAHVHIHSVTIITIISNSTLQCIKLQCMGFRLIHQTLIGASWSLLGGWAFHHIWYLIVGGCCQVSGHKSVLIHRPAWGRILRWSS